MDDAEGDRGPGTGLAVESTEGGAMPGGTIFLRNGASCAGKASIDRAIQRFADSPWLLLGADILGITFPSFSIDGDRTVTGFA